MISSYTYKSWVCICLHSVVKSTLYATDPWDCIFPEYTHALTDSERDALYKAKVSKRFIFISASNGEVQLRL